MLLPVIGGLLLVGCGHSAADEACAQLQEYETDVVEADEDHANEVLTETYAELNDLAEETEGELGEALVELQPLFLQLEGLTGADETAAAEAPRARNKSTNTCATSSADRGCRFDCQQHSL